MTVTRFRQTRVAAPLAVILAALIVKPALLVASDVTPPVAPPPRPPIVGFVDTHLHQFANKAFGGLEVWGSPMDPLLDENASLADARARALPDSDFIYVSAADAAGYLYLGGVPVVGTPVAESCTAGCSPRCPPGTGTPVNACVKITIHGNNGDADLLNKLVPHGSNNHGVAGYPDMNGWPAWDVLTTQQAYWEWLGRAHDHGLKLMVMLAVNNSLLCQLGVRRASFGCGDDGSVNRQIQGAKDLEAYIDGRAGGPRQGFYRIVYSSEEAREAIADGKLAVVLGTEVDTAWGCTPGSPGCTPSFIEDRVQEYFDMGIRHVFPVHLIDNKFGGTAVYNGLFELDNFIVNSSWYDIEPCGAPIEWRSDIREMISDAKDVVTGFMVAMIVTLGAPFPLLEPVISPLLAALPLIAAVMPILAGGIWASALGPFLALPGLGGAVLVFTLAYLIWQAPGEAGSATDGNCNNLGLTPEGHTLINALMDHDMIIDVDHTDTPTFDAILSIAESRHYAGIVSGHTGLIGASLTRDEITDMGATFNASDSARHEAAKTDSAVQRIMNVGGFLSIGLGGSGRLGIRDFSPSDGVAFDCGRSSQSFAQSYLYATHTLGLTAVGIGSDINGFAGSPAPRYGSKACGGDFPGGYDVNRLTGRINYATATDYFGAPLSQYTFGSQTWDYNVDGFAHVGLYPDFIADLRADNLSNSDLGPLFNGAEGYVRMWEKVNDHEPPTVRCGTVGEDWHAGDVTVPCLSFDFGWGLAAAADANFSLSTNVPNGTETGNASTGTHASICDNATQCSGEIPAITGINVDKKAPTVTVTTPPAGTPAYVLNQVVNADYGCTDGGSGLDTCVGPVASGAAIVTTVGTHAFDVTGVDNVDNTAVVAHPYNVSFAICLLYDETKSHNAGSTVPIKLELCDANGVNVSSPSLELTATAVTQKTTNAPGPLEDAGQANPDSVFRFVSNSYIFNLKTTGMSTGTYALTFTATGDPIAHEVLFQVR